MFAGAMTEQANQSISNKGRGSSGRYNMYTNGGAGRGYQRWEKQTHKFVGNTKDMNSHVFQLRTEQRKKEQFQDTVDQLLISTQPETAQGKLNISKLSSQM